MPTKCPFCRRNYIRSSAYVQHLRTADANLDIVLVSTVEYPSSGDSINDVETGILEHSEAYEVQESNYESDPDPTGYGLNPFTAYEPDTEILTTLRLRYPADRSIIHQPDKQLKTSTDLKKKTAISARIRWHCSVVGRVSN